MKFEYSDDNKRYHTWNYHLRHKFGGKVMKIALNGGFTCPNIDGTKGTGGCTYCSESGSGDFAGNPDLDVCEQFREICAELHKKWKTAAMYIPYFQARTNTYAPTARLRSLYEPVLAVDGVVGLAVATRADCISDETLDYLTELNERTYLTVELGLQSAFDFTGERINRCHTYAEFLHGYKRLEQRGINVCVHLIDGLPGEGKSIMLATARAVAALRPHCVKLHLLHIIEGTPMCEQYRRGEVRALEMEEYTDIIVSQLEVLPPETVIQRLTGDGARESLAAPEWSIRKFEVLNSIDKKMAERDTWQGRCFLG